MTGRTRFRTVPGGQRTWGFVVFGALGVLFAACIGLWIADSALQNAPLSGAEITGTWVEKNGEGAIELRSDGVAVVAHLTVPREAWGMSDKYVESARGEWQIAQPNRVLVRMDDETFFALDSARSLLGLDLALRADADPSSADRVFGRVCCTSG